MEETINILCGILLFTSILLNRNIYISTYSKLPIIWPKTGKFVWYEHRKCQHFNLLRFYRVLHINWVVLK